MAVPSSQPNWRFGAYEVDQRSGELRRGGVLLRIQEQPFRILITLLDRPGEVVTREELREILWPGDTFVDFEHSLNAAVNKLREALGDSAGHPKFVETVPRRGYRFVYPVQGQHGAGRLTTPAAEQATTKSGRGERARWIGIGAALLATALAIVLKLSGTLDTFHLQRQASLVAVPVTSYPGVETNPTFSPDGSQIAFSWNGKDQDNFDIYVTLSGGAEPSRLTEGPEDDSAPAWSPDGRWIAFLRQGASGESEVRLVSPLGGSGVRLGKVTVDLVFGYPHMQGPFLAWSPDAKWLAVQDQAATDEPFHLSLLSLESGEIRRLTRPVGIWGDSFPAFSPDGRSLAFMRVGDGGDRLLVLALDERLQPHGEPRALMAGNRPSTGLSFTADGNRVIYSSGTDGDQTQIWEVSVSGSSPPRALSLVGGGGVLATASRLGNRLAYSRVTQQWCIRRFERLGPGAYSASQCLLRSTRLKIDPRFSPDASKIAFASTRSGLPEIWVATRDGGEPHRLTSFQGVDLGSPSWSPDGNTIAFDGFDGRRADIFTVHSGGGPVRPVTTDVAADFRPSWSRDGRWIYFASDRTGEFEVWRTPFAGGNDEQVTHAGGWDPIESLDGRFLYYLKKDGTLWRTPTGGGAETQICDSCRVYTLGATLAVVEGGIYFVDQQVEPDGRSTIRYLDLASGKVELVAKIDKPRPSCLSASLDGRTILYSQLDQTSADILLVENFR